MEIREETNFTENEKTETILFFCETRTNRKEAAEAAEIPKRTDILHTLMRERA